jgi:hypothetical protein
MTSGTSAAAHPRRAAPPANAHVIEPRITVAGSPLHPRLHDISRTDHSSTHPATRIDRP